MREVFVRRVAGFLIALLVAVLLTAKHGPFRGTLARALESRIIREALKEDANGQRVLAPPVLSAKEVERLERGEFEGPYPLGDAGEEPRAFK